MLHTNVAHGSIAWEKATRQPGSVPQHRNRPRNTSHACNVICGASLTEVADKKVQSRSATSFTAKNRFKPEHGAFMASLALGYFTVQEDAQGHFMQLVQGTLPPDLQGTLLRNGPGRFEAAADAPYGHPYDGDGFVASITIKDGRAFFRSRFVQTPELQAELQAGKVLFRNAFATQRAGGLLYNAMDTYVKNTANTNVVCWGGRCLALFEAGQPYRLDPTTLCTLGLDDLWGWARPGQPTSLGSPLADTVGSVMMRAMGTGKGVPYAMARLGGVAITAHPRPCVTGGLKGGVREGCIQDHQEGNKEEEQNPYVAQNLMFLGYHVQYNAQGQLESHLTFKEYDEEWKLVEVSEYVLPGYAFVHDFAVTENYIIVFQNPVSVDMLRFLSGQAAAASSIVWAEQPTDVHIIPRGYTMNSAYTMNTSGNKGEPHSSKGEPHSSKGDGSGNSRNSSRASGNSAHMHTSTINGDTTPRTHNTPRVLTLPPTFVFHHANAYEQQHQGDTVVVVDSIAYPRLPEIWPEGNVHHEAGDAAFQGGLHRCVFNLTTNTATMSRLWPEYMEMVAINDVFAGRPHRCVYGYHSMFEQERIGVVKVDVDSGHVDTYNHGYRTFMSQPCFVPRPGRDGTTCSAEDDGWLLSLTHDSNTCATELVVLDASNLAAGPVAVLRTETPIPVPVHVSWSPVCYV